MKQLSTLACATFLFGCATAPLQEVPANETMVDYITASQLSEVGQIRKGNHDHWKYINDRYIIYRGPKDYLVEFRNDCGELSDNSWLPADYITDHRNLRARVDTIRGCIIEKIYPIDRTQRAEIRQLIAAPPSSR